MKRSHFFLLLALFAISAAVLAPAFASAETTLIAPIPNTPNAGQSLKTYLTAVFKYGLGLAALIALAQLVFGAVQYTTSAGAPSLQEDAKSRMRSAIVGVILLIGAGLIWNLIVNKNTSTSGARDTSPAGDTDNRSPETIRQERLDTLATSALEAANRLKEKYGVFGEDAIYEFVGQSHLHWYNKELLEQHIRETQVLINNVLDEIGDDPVAISEAHRDFDLAFRYILEQSSRNDYFQDETGGRMGASGGTLYRFGATREEFNEYIANHVEERYRPKIYDPALLN